MKPPPRSAGGLDPRFAAQAQVALGHLQARRFVEAAASLASLTMMAPLEPDLRRAYAEALLGAGDPVRAEAEAHAAIAADKRRPAAWLTLASVMAATNRPADEEKALRRALSLDRRFALAAVRLNQLLLRQSRSREAVQATAAIAAGSRDAAVLGAHAAALKAEGRLKEALDAYERARDIDPQHGVAEHNVASLLADLRRDDEALAATDRAFAEGLDAAQTWLVRAHALQGLNRNDDAEAAYGEALRREPGLVGAITDLARLVWMRTGDVTRACAVYDRALSDGARDPAVLVEKARLQEFAGEPTAALATITSAVQSGGGARASVVAAQIAAPIDPDLSAFHAEAAVAVQPDDPGAWLTLAEARLAQGRAAEASALAAKTLSARPAYPGALAVQAAAWRLLEDPRYTALYDYAAFVSAYMIETPSGWPDLSSFLVDLSASLTRLHALHTHPVGQSLRQGTQTSVNLQRVNDPAISAAFAAFDAPIRSHIARLGEGRNTGRAWSRGYAYSGAWSVRLKPGGRHVDHIHSEGRISSAFYVDLPAAVEGTEREGWIKFGQPGVPHGPVKLEAEHWLKPEPGKLVLFPSYMWHGTQPFGGDAPRLTMAFDLVPA